MLRIVEKESDLSQEEVELINNNGYVSIDTETTGLNYLEDKLCTIQLYADEYGIIIKFNDYLEYPRLKSVLSSSDVTKIFHNAVFDVSFLMKNLKMNSFGKLVCTKISSKLVNGIDHNNSLKPLLKEYLNVDIDKSQQLSNWGKAYLTTQQINYAINDVKYLFPLWKQLYKELKYKKLEYVAFNCFSFIPNYKILVDMGIENIFIY